MASKDSGYGSLPQTEGDALVRGDTGESSPPSLRSQLIAEFIGTTILVQVGTGSNSVAIFMQDTSGMWQIGVIWILAATLGIYSAGNISGGHLNPAVTLSFAVWRPNDFGWKKVLPYWCAQILGGIVATFMNIVIFLEAISRYEAKSGFLRGDADGIKSAAAFSDYWSLSKYVKGGFHACCIEAFGAAFLVFVVFMVTHRKNNVPSGAVAPLVGVTIGSMVTLLGPLTNAGINPARDLGPRIAAAIAGWGVHSFTNWLAYSVGPLIGGPIGGLVADKLLMS